MKTVKSSTFVKSLDTLTEKFAYEKWDVLFNLLMEAWRIPPSPPPNQARNYLLHEMSQ